jgi:hypothetical protein
MTTLCLRRLRAAAIAASPSPAMAPAAPEPADEAAANAHALSWPCATAGGVSQVPRSQAKPGAQSFTVAHSVSRQVPSTRLQAWTPQSCGTLSGQEAP